MDLNLDLSMSALLILGGAVAGFVNAFAGGGSALTLPLLMLAGLDASHANGSNRLAVLAQAAASSQAFHQRGVRPWPLTARAAAPILLGAALGASLASRLDASALQRAFGLTFLALAALTIARPRWLEAHPAGEVIRPSPATRLALFATGVYGGALQAGVGIPLLVVAARGLGLDLVRANAVKVALVGLFTLVALVIFGGAGHIHWAAGGLVALGGLLGSRLGVKIAVERGAAWIRWGVALALGASGLRLLW